MTNPGTVVVVGGTCDLGKHLAAHYANKGHKVVVTSRDPGRLAGYGWYGDVTAVPMDARESHSVTAAFESAGQIDVVYYLLHGIGESGFRESDNRAAANVAEGARAVLTTGGTGSSQARFHAWWCAPGA